MIPLSWGIFTIMEITGKITNILPIQTGIGKAGNEWKKQEIIIQTEESYPKTICITLWGSTIDDNIKQEDKIKALIDIESREFNGKWYTTVKARNIDLLPSTTGTNSPVDESEEKESYPFDEQEEIQELPF